VGRGTTLNANDATGIVGGTNDDSLLVNDTDPENNSLTAVKVTNPTHGTLTLNANGTFTYTHNNDSATSDSFTYRVSDGTYQSNIATVTITISPGAGTSDRLLAGGGWLCRTIDTTIKPRFRRRRRCGRP
jgi:VCBS repeat-containing protein